MPRPVPVFVKVADRLRRLLGEAHEARDLSPPLAADLDQLACRPLTFDPDGEEAPGSVEQSPVGAYGAGDVEGRLRQAAPVDGLERPLGLEVVGAEEGTYLRGVARAACVL